MPCFMTFSVKSKFQPLPDNKFCCGTKAHYLSLLNATKSVREKTQWDTDGPNDGTDTEPNSMSVLSRIDLHMIRTMHCLQMVSFTK
jgi:hypothetical protein